MLAQLQTPGVAARATELLTAANAHGNLADACLTAGQKDLARRHAGRALTLLDAHAEPASSW
jgi:hypothetical protein